MECISCQSILTKKISSLEIDWQVFVCENCNLKQTDPEKTIDSKKTYKKSFWDNTHYKDYTGTDFSDKDVQDLVKSWNSWFRYFKNFLSNKKSVLDIGSGSGISLVMIENKGYDVTGIEPDSRNVKLINERLKKGNCVSGYFEDVKLEKKFDIIWSSHSFEHVKNPNSFLEKCSQLLADDGVLCIVVPDGDSPKMLNQSIKNINHLFHYSKKSLQILAKKHNFDMISCDSIALMNRNLFRFNKILRKCQLTSISDKFYPLYPYLNTTKNNGEEIRIALKKI